MTAMGMVRSDAGRCHDDFGDRNATGSSLRTFYVPADVG